MLGLDNPIHLLILGIVLLLLFGAKRLPEMGQSLGTGLRGFKDSLSGETAPSGISEHVAAAHTDDSATSATEPLRAPEPQRAPAQPVA